MEVKINFTDLISLEKRLIKNSNNYHQHPSNSSSCEMYREFYNRRCPCENYYQDQEANPSQQLAAI